MRRSVEGHVRKDCGCVRWKECTHPWYVDVEVAGVRYCRSLDKLLGRHCPDIKSAREQADRAILAWKDSRPIDAIQRGDRPTLARLLEDYGKRPGASDDSRAKAKPIERTVVNGRPIGEYFADEITAPMIEAFRTARPAVAANRDLAHLRAMFKWAVLADHLAATPFRKGDVPTVRLAQEEPRTRRLQAGEETKLLASCEPGTNKRGEPWSGNPWLKDLIVAALETGCRRGELLSLQWHQVRHDLFFPAGKTKAKKPRRVPISSVLRAVLDRRRNDPTGEPLGPETYVFGDEIGRRRSPPRKAWDLLCDRAHIDGLTFHDLRREAGSRWMDAGVPLSTIQKWLGHANISQTSTYLAATGGGDHAAMEAFERVMGRLRDPEPSPGTEQNQKDRPNEVEAEKTH